MTTITSARVLGLALAMLAGCAAAHAQTMPWPTDAPRAPGQAPWPGEAQPAQPAQPMAMPVPTGPMMGAGPPPNADQQACIREFGGYRDEVEKRAMAAKAGSEKKVAREEMCNLVSAYSAAEAKWLKFSETNMTKCGIPKQAVEQIKGVHLRTADARKKICASGPQAGGPAAAPSLSDALGTTRLPTPVTEKPKAGGTLDTLTGNALAR